MITLVITNGAWFLMWEESGVTRLFELASLRELGEWLT